MTQVAMMGTGSWATAFGTTLVDGGATVRMWGRRPEVVAAINAGCNTEALPDLRLPDTITATTDPAEALVGADLVVLAVPAQRLRSHLVQWGRAIPVGIPVVSLVKGIELGSGRRMSEVITEEADVEPHRVVVVSGPNLAAEIARRQPAASMVAGLDAPTVDRVMAACATGLFRPYPSGDVVGVELGGAVKNVVALAVGMAEGMGMGDNTRASIVTRGLAEITRLGVRLGADPQTFMGLAGVGDLIATCMSPLSRNRTFGENLGRGMSVAEAAAVTWQVTEGLTSSHAVLDLGARHDLEMPIAAGVAAVIDGALTPAEVVDELMSRSRKHERV